MDESEIRKIVDKTGIMKPKQQDNVLFFSLLGSMPATVFYIGMDWLLFKQYSMPFSLSYAIMKYPCVFIALLTLIYYTTKLEKHRILQISLTLVSALCGIYLISYTTKHNTWGNIKKAPGLAVVWIIAIFQLRLELATLSLIPPLVYYYKDVFFASNTLF